MSKLDKDKIDKHDVSAKVLIIGNSQVGKSCILLRYTDNVFGYIIPSTVGTYLFKNQ